MHLTCSCMGNAQKQLSEENICWTLVLRATSRGRCTPHNPHQQNAIVMAATSFIPQLDWRSQTFHHWTDVYWCSCCALLWYFNFTHLLILSIHICYTSIFTWRTTSPHFPFNWVRLLVLFFVHIVFCVYFWVDNLMYFKIVAWAPVMVKFPYDGIQKGSYLVSDTD